MLSSTASKFCVRGSYKFALKSSPSSTLHKIRIQALLSRSYHERVLDHYNNPRNQGTLPKDKLNVGTGLVGAPACGDVMRVQLEISEEGIVTDAKFKTFGCGSAIASSSLATEWVKGKHIDDCLKIKNTEIAKHLALPPVKLHCSMLAEDAIRSAVADYKNKQVQSVTAQL